MLQMQHVIFTTYKKLNMNTKAEKHYTNSLYYEMILTTKYLQMYGMQLFEEKQYEISIDEFAALDVIYCNSGICQRDLAKIILKDRANTGRTLEGLEQKGLITRTLVTRNNRPIKQINLTKAGEKMLIKITGEIKNNFKEINKEISDEEIEKVCSVLKKMQNTVAKIIKTQI